MQLVGGTTHHTRSLLGSSDPLHHTVRSVLLLPFYARTEAPVSYCPRPDSLYEDAGDPGLGPPLLLCASVAHGPGSFPTLSARDGPVETLPTALSELMWNQGLCTPTSEAAWFWFI